MPCPCKNKKKPDINPKPEPEPASSDAKNSIEKLPLFFPQYLFESQKKPVQHPSSYRNNLVNTKSKFRMTMFN